MTRTDLVLVGAGLGGIAAARFVEAGVSNTVAMAGLVLWLMLGSWLLQKDKK